MATAPGFSGSSGQQEASYDVAVVGAGFTGLTVARALAKAGLKVAVFERGAVGDGASGRNGGHLSNGLAHSYASVVRDMGADTARSLYHAFDRSLDLIEAIVEEESIDCQFRRCGKLKVAAKPGHVEALRKNADLIRREADQDVRFLDKAELQSEICSDKVFGGLLSPKGAMLHMGAYLHGLAAAVLRHGGQIFEQCPVTSTQKTNGDWQICLPHGQVQSNHLVLAGGATGAHLSKPVSRQILPIGSYVIATRALTDTEVAATLPGGRTYVTSPNVGNYFRLAPDKRLIFGGRARFSTKADGHAAAKSVPILRRSLEDLFPSLAGIEIDHAFGGLVDMSWDRFPRLGLTPVGAHYAIGLSGHGAQISAALGTEIAHRILGEDRSNGSDPFVALRPKPFPPGAIFALPLIGAHARAKDWWS